MTTSALELVQTLFRQLRARRFPLGIPDLAALRDSLAAGFGWRSRERLRELIVALWAKSRREAEVVRALFEGLPWPSEWIEEGPPEFALIPDGAIPQNFPKVAPEPAPSSSQQKPGAAIQPAPPPPKVQVLGGLPDMTIDEADLSDARLLFVEQYPLNTREIAQALRRLRRPLRFGPAVELDVTATILRSARAGLNLPPVLTPIRRNTARLLMLMDSSSSMEPYRPFVELFCAAVAKAGWLQRVQQFYFHNVPVEGVDRSILRGLKDHGIHPHLDPILPSIEAVTVGTVFRDATLTNPVPLDDVLHQSDANTVGLIVSDVGASRSGRDAIRMLNTLSFAKGLRSRLRAAVWLNPVPQGLWAHTDAQQLARFVPMFPLDRRGIEDAVNVLRGQPANLERPI